MHAHVLPRLHCLRCFSSFAASCQQICWFQHPATMHSHALAPAILRSSCALPRRNCVCNTSTQKARRLLDIARQESVAAAVARNARNLVVAVDLENTEGSYKALKWTLEHLYREGDVLHLLHVVPASTSLNCCGGFELPTTLPPEEGLQETMAAHAAQYFSAYLNLARKHGADCELELVHGTCNQTVSKTICRKVEELSAAVVVLSEQKRGFFEDFFMQAPVTRQVVESCTRPTLVLNRNL